MFTVDNNNKKNLFSGIEIRSNVSKISKSHIIEQRLTVVPSIRHRCNAKHNKNCKMYIHEIKHIRLVDVFQFFSFYLRIKWLRCSRINNAFFNLFHQVFSTLQNLKNGTIAAKKKKKKKSQGKQQLINTDTQSFKTNESVISKF